VLSGNFLFRGQKQVEQENRTVERGRRGKRTRVQKGEPSTIAEAEQIIDQMVADKQVVTESSRSGGRSGRVFGVVANVARPGIM
jgi:hypothetical protein